MQLNDPSIARDQCLIGGKWTGMRTLDVTNPATGAEIGCVPDFGQKETRAAIEAANAVFSEWSGKLAKERAVILRRWYELQRDHKEDLA